VLEPLDTEEVARFVGVRLAAAQRPSALFTSEAVWRPAQHSGGVFRPLIILASASLFFAELRSAPQVTEVDVDEATAMATSTSTCRSGLRRGPSARRGGGAGPGG